MKIVICGSMTASKEMLEIEKKLQELNHEVVLPPFTHDYASLGEMDKMHSESANNKIKHNLVGVYYEEIRNNDAVLVINIERRGIKGYIGGNSFLEIGFAHVLNKPIYFWDEIPEMNYRDEIEAMQPIIIYGDLSLIK
jgi:hypothetical protein